MTASLGAQIVVKELTKVKSFARFSWNESEFEP